MAKLLLFTALLIVLCSCDEPIAPQSNNLPTQDGRGLIIYTPNKNRLTLEPNPFHSIWSIEGYVKDGHVYYDEVQQLPNGTDVVKTTELSWEYNVIRFLPENELF